MFCAGSGAWAGRLADNGGRRFAHAAGDAWKTLAHVAPGRRPASSGHRAPGNAPPRNRTPNPTDRRTACSDDADRTKKLDCQPSSVNDHHSSRLGSVFETGKFRQPRQGTVTVHGTGGLFLFDFLCSFFGGEECPVQLIRHRTPGGSSRPGQIAATGSFRPNGPKFGHKLSCPTLSNATRP